VVAEKETIEGGESTIKITEDKKSHLPNSGTNAENSNALVDQSGWTSNASNANAKTMVQTTDCDDTATF